MRAEQMQVDVLAITDHDCIGAIEPARAYIAQHDSKVRLISGVEISTKWHGFEIHILGLDVNNSCETFCARLQTQLVKRRERAAKICEKLAKIGIEDILKDAQALLNKNTEYACISRAHIAKVLVTRGVCNNFQQAFSKYLGKDKRAYVKPNWIEIDEAVNWIRDASGVSVIAHPFRYDMSTKWLRRLAAEFANIGGDGMEVTHPNLAPTKEKLMIDIAKENDLAASLGSDFHFPSRWTELGRKLKLPEDIEPIWERFRRTRFVV